MKIVNPVKGLTLSLHPKGDITQWFGANPELYRRFGLAYHNGIDIVKAWGTPMYATEAGTVVEVKNDPSGFGKHVRFITDREEDDTILEVTYGHCSKIYVSIGDRVEAGDHIADMGNTGFVVSGATPFWPINPYAGTHLHFGMRRVKRDRKGWAYNGSTVKISVLNYDNGVKGAIDPYNYLAQAQEQYTSRQIKMLTLISLYNQLIHLLKLANGK